MRKRNNITSLVMFLTALVVGFCAQPGWCSFGTLNSNYTQCDVASFGGHEYVGGMVVLPSGAVLVANIGSGIYLFNQGSINQGSTCPATPVATQLSASLYLGMALGLDGQVYANAWDGTGNVYIVNPVTGLPTSTVLRGVNGLGMALDPLTGDLYVSTCHKFNGPCPGTDIRKISGLYGGTPTITPFANGMSTAAFDGLAWSCDGTRLIAASHTDKIYQWDSHGNMIPGFPLTVPKGSTPDGIAFGREGTALAGYFFVNNEHTDGVSTPGTVTKIKNDGSTQQIIASGGNQGDFVTVDTQGNLLLAQATLVTRFSSNIGGQWVLPGSGLCSDVGCGAQAALNSCLLQSLDANIILTLSQSACGGGCESCAILNQARTTLISLLQELDGTNHCLDPLKLTVTNLYASCPCNPKVLDGGSVCWIAVQGGGSGGGTDITKLSSDPAKTKPPFGLDLESYDPVRQTLIRRVTSP